MKIFENEQTLENVKYPGRSVFHKSSFLDHSFVVEKS